MQFPRAERRFTNSLRFKMAIGVTLPVFLALSALSTLLYIRERQLLLDRLEETAVRLGEVIRGSLRSAMLARDQSELTKMLTDIGQQETVLRVAVFNADGQLMLTDRPADFDPPPDRATVGCSNCHLPNGVLQQHSTVVQLPNQPSMLRSSTLILNDAACYGCHPAAQRVLGVLIADFSLSALEHDALGDLQGHLAFSGLVTVLVTAGVYALVHALVVRRVERFQYPLQRFAQGDFSERVPLARGERDELGELAEAVNRMAEGLARQAELERRAREARLNAIIEERQRLSRELHDGVAQVLGYVSTKATAVRLLLQRGQTVEAAGQLRQMEEAAHGVFADLRQAILDLRTTFSGERGFINALSEYIERFRELTGVPTDLTVAPGAEALTLPPESEVQLLRIVQEALTNVRKHARARHAWVQLDPDGGRRASIIIGDDGRGFDPSAVERARRPHFGLVSMQERAEAVGGTFNVESRPGAGTRVVVCLPLGSEEE